MFTTLLATHDGWDGPGPWALIPLTFFLIWLTVIVFAIVRFRRGGGPPWARHNGRDVLDARFARGEITADEYRERRDVLREQGR